MPIGMQPHGLTKTQEDELKDISRKLNQNKGFSIASFVISLIAMICALISAIFVII
jgi:hypothetical protein